MRTAEEVIKDLSSMQDVSSDSIKRVYEAIRKIPCFQDMSDESIEQIHKNEGYYKIQDKLKWVRKSIGLAKQKRDLILENLTDVCNDIREYEKQIKEYEEELIKLEARYSIEHPKQNICKYCRYCSCVDEFLDEYVIHKFCCTLHNQEHKNICIVNANDTCTYFAVNEDLKSVQGVL